MAAIADPVVACVRHSLLRTAAWKGDSGYIDFVPHDKLVVRATDGDGALQIKDERWTAPHGATGYHKVTARVVG